MTWEYKAVELAYGLSEDQLNKLGADGWELVCVAGQQLIFKREKS